MEYVFEILSDIKGRMKAQGVYGKDEYIQLIDDVIAQWRREEKLDDDYNFKALKENLETRWPDVESELSK